jgi:hypothetical protein
MVRTIGAGEIDLDHAPRRRRDLIEVVMDGEAIIYEPDGRAKHQLNPLATALWHCIDGSVTVRQLCEDLTDGLDRDLDQVQEDLLGYVRQLGADGLLVGVRRADDARSAS